MSIAGPLSLPRQRSTTTPRWLSAAMTTAAQSRVRMPWERGLRREAFIARRKAEATRTPAAAALRHEPA